MPDKLLRKVIAEQHASIARLTTKLKEQQAEIVKWRTIAVRMSKTQRATQARLDKILAQVPVDGEDVVIPY